jgi:hypothetical protein
MGVLPPRFRRMTDSMHNTCQGSDKVESEEQEYWTRNSFIAD